MRLHQEYPRLIDRQGSGSPQPVGFGGQTALPQPDSDHSGGVGPNLRTPRPPRLSQLRHCSESHQACTTDGSATQACRFGTAGTERHNRQGASADDLVLHIGSTWKAARVETVNDLVLLVYMYITRFSRPARTPPWLLRAIQVETECRSIEKPLSVPRNPM